MDNLTNKSNMNPLLVESFLRDGIKAADMISSLIEKEDFYDAGNLQLFRITVHGVKSSLRNIDEAQLADDAGELEDAARSGNFEIIKTKAVPFLTGLRTAIEKMQPEQSSSTDGDDPPDIKERLQELKEMCADYNRRGALNIIADITICTPETRTVLNTVKELIGQSDFEEAEALL